MVTTTTTKSYGDRDGDGECDSNLKILKILQVVNSVTMIHYRALFRSAANNCQFAPICPNLPPLLQFAAIRCCNLAQYAAICRDLLQFVSKLPLFCGPGQPSRPPLIFC